MNINEGLNIVPGDKNIRKAGFPLALFLNGFDNGSGIRACENGKVVIMLGEILGQFQGEPL